MSELNAWIGMSLFYAAIIALVLGVIAFCKFIGYLIKRVDPIKSKSEPLTEDQRAKLIKNAKSYHETACRWSYNALSSDASGAVMPSVKPLSMKLSVTDLDVVREIFKTLNEHKDDLPKELIVKLEAIRTKGGDNNANS